MNFLLVNIVRQGVVAILLVGLGSACGFVQEKFQIPDNAPWSKRIADTFLYRHQGAVTYDSVHTNRKWNYEQGMMLTALEQMWMFSGDEKYFDFIKNNLDHYIEDNGNIKTYEKDEYNIDNILPGRALLTVYHRTKEQKYKTAIETLRQQLREHPRTNAGSFWHKKIYPYQVWLDGLFMAQPFYTKFAVMFNDSNAFDDIANQFIWIAQRTKDPETGLLYHAWDETKQQKWANPNTGCSPNFWARAMGWYAMALVDVLDFFPINHPKRAELIGIFKDLADALLKFRNQETNLWFQVVNLPDREGNYLETSASCMFAYSFAKGASKGYLDKKFFRFAEETFDGVIKHKVTVDDNGFVDLHGTCKSAGLGGNPYRDGSFEYYISEPQRINDMKGIGPFLLTAIEIEKYYKSKEEK